MDNGGIIGSPLIDLRQEVGSRSDEIASHYDSVLIMEDVNGVRRSVSYCNYDCVPRKIYNICRIIGREDTLERTVTGREKLIYFQT